ncbi:TetR family transcriptional regulator [Algoriphagus ratkowskyi]|uniref:TetR family transcriptional regulator n=1 Tax=Algoriphagus ratkowskyi TaxID=57028 RepID=A0A2W7SED7_9BACT|nr:TetR/AcrR family transcriptional regulator [Algoriphagus ratkowskyi]PZX61205.1 TetR family transcriptional regulator [Algoriphagus ratkowskyi]TXD79324.1 TetR/AcrR family transcriptional regulator [Algoriphagus ratkowskyi]
MARQKAYNEEVVVEKAMNLFWRNGFETTSMQMLEKEMGINKFSIYASFGSKNGLFLESLKCYMGKIKFLLNTLENSDLGIAGIKKYFYDFIEFTRETDFGKGCLVTNTANEINDEADEKIKQVIGQFTGQVREAFASILKRDDTKDQVLVDQQADYLIIAMVGLSSATRFFAQSQLDNYIENVFNSI